MSDSYLKNDIKKFCDALDIEYQVDFVREYSKIGDSVLYGGKHCGSDAEHKGAEFIAECLKEIGVPKVELIRAARAGISLMMPRSAYRGTIGS